MYRNNFSEKATQSEASFASVADSTGLAITSSKTVRYFRTFLWLNSPAQTHTAVAKLILDGPALTCSKSIRNTRDSFLPRI